MALTLYNKKRNFKETSEPAGLRGGKVKKSISNFHLLCNGIRHTHFIMISGLSWMAFLKAGPFPKALHLNPKDKRLAMMVEDHPYDYKNFAGEYSQRKLWSRHCGDMG